MHFEQLFVTLSISKFARVMVVPTQQGTLVQHIFRLVHHNKIVPHHIQLPPLTLVRRHQIDVPEVRDTTAIRNPSERLKPKELSPFRESPTTSCPFANTAMMGLFCLGIILRYELQRPQP